MQRRYPANGLQAVASNVELPDLEPATLEQRRARIERAPKPWTIGLIGKVDHRLKGIHVALDAIAAVRDQLPELRFRILGEGSPARWSARAQQLGLGDQVQFDGRLAPGEAVRRWLDEIDLYLQPSFHEGLPRATIEAMSRGCPVLGSTAGGIPELLPESRLHRPGDATTLGRQLAALAASQQAQRDDAERNFSYVERFTASVLRPRRAEFWRQFAQHCERHR